MVVWRERGDYRITGKMFDKDKWDWSTSLRADEIGKMEIDVPQPVIRKIAELASREALEMYLGDVCLMVSVRDGRVCVSFSGDDSIGDIWISAPLDDLIEKAIADGALNEMARADGLSIVRRLRAEITENDKWRSRK